MSNWFYLTRHGFEQLLHDELGRGLASALTSIGFDSPVSFLIGETSNDILNQIQQIFSRYFCHKLHCTDQCLSCSLTPPSYAKLTWFVQRLAIMSPLTKPFIKQTSSSPLKDVPKNNSTINQPMSFSTNLWIITLIFIVNVISWLFCFCVNKKSELV